MKLKIGTRRSKLALWQSNLVAEKLNALDVQTELVEIESFGDKEQDLPLHKLGDKVYSQKHWMMLYWTAK